MMHTLDAHFRANAQGKNIEFVSILTFYKLLLILTLDLLSIYVYRTEVNGFYLSLNK